MTDLFSGDHGWQCARCAGDIYEGTGWVSCIVEGPVVGDDGKKLLYDAARPCACHGTQKAKKAIVDARVPYAFRGTSLDTMQRPSRGHESLFDSLVDYCLEVESGGPRKAPTGLLLAGVPGCGKSHAASAIIHRIAMADRGSMLWVNVPKMFEDIRSDLETGSEAIVMARMRDTWLVVLDDLGVDGHTQWQTSLIYRILDHRNRDDKITLVTSNHPLQELDTRVGPRSSSRIAQMCKEIRFPVLDWRRRQTSRH